MRRRRAGKLAALAAARDIPVRVADWICLPCPGCGRNVAFLPDQRKNTCAHCRTRVTRGLV